MFKSVREDLAAIMARDPAARSRLEIILCYPGFHAIATHRLAHWLWRRRVRLPARLFAHVARILTGIEIHPGATIGRRVFIDHGFGVVIGETAEVGDDVTLYQGVTLGGTSTEQGKRHPTLDDGVIVGSGAQVLGPIRLGVCSRVGANAVVVRDVPSGATVIGVPARIVGSSPSISDEEFVAYGTDPELPDPVARALELMGRDLAALRSRLESIEQASSSASEQERSEVVASRPRSAGGGRS